MKNLKYSILLSAVLIVLAGCAKDLMDNQDAQVGIVSDLIHFTLNGKSSEDGVTTKSESMTSYEGDMVLYAADGDSLVMGIHSEDTPILVDGIDNATTKGVPVTNSNLSTMFDGSSDAKRIAVRSFLPGNLSTPYINDYLVYTGNNGDPWPAKNGPYYWPKVDDLQFWSWAPSTINPTISDNGLQFSYTTPVHTSADNDAKEEKELMASFTKASKSTYSGHAPLNMKHLLSAIKFQIGVTMAGTIKSISLVDVKNTGTCTLNTTNIISWSSISGSSTYTQSFNKEVTENPSGTPAQIMTKDEDGTVFMMVPQTLGTQKISLVFEAESGVTKTYSANIPVGQSGKWEPGKTYTYTITNSGEVDVEITDEVDDNVKSNVHIKNTGTVREYIRAIILGNWLDSDNKIVSSWSYNKSNPTECGFEGLTSDESNDWIYNSLDGYYYYKYPVVPNQETGKPLFTKFTSGTAPIVGSHFEMVISVQGVEWDSAKSKLKQAWAKAPADRLSSDINK